MAISSVVPVNNYAGNGSVTTFDFNFLIENSSELKVTKTDSGANVTELLLNVDYTIHEIGNNSGSYITFPIAGSSHSVLASDEIITLALTLEAKQESTFPTDIKLSLPVIEKTFDYVVRLIQILNRKMDRAIKVKEKPDFDVDKLVENIDKIELNLNKIITVNDDISNIDVVSSDKTNIDAVAAVASSVSDVAGVLTEVQTVSSNITNLSTCANNITTINNASSNALTAQNKAIEAASSASQAAGSAAISKNWAVKMDGPVENAEYSSKYYAMLSRDITAVTFDQLNSNLGYNKSGELLSDLRLFYYVFYYNHSIFDSTKFTLTGTPILSENGILTLKDTSNYVVASFNILNKAFKIKFRVKTPDDITTLHRYLEYNYANQNIIRFTQSYYGSPYNKAEFIATFFTSANNNVNISIPAADANIQASTLYDIELEYTATKAYMRFKEVGSTDYIEYSADTNGEFYTVASAVAWLGYSTNAGGEIDLKYFEVFADNVPVFSGAKTGLDTIKADNYTLTGTPTITTDGVLTSADGSNYLSSKNVSIANKPFKIKFRYKTASSISTTHAIMSYRIGYNGTPYNIDVLQDSNARFQVVSYLGSNIDTHGTVNSITPSTTYNVEFEFTSTNQYLRFAKDGEDFTEISASNSQGLFPVDSQFAFGIRLVSTATPFGDAQLDLNSIRIYVDGNLVYQPCLKIPYTDSSTGSKVADVVYLNRVIDAYEQGYDEKYYVIDETNKKAALPLGEIYGDIEQNRKAIGTKANLDLSNISQTGKETALSWGMPDVANRVQVNSGVLTTEVSYTAPSKGYIAPNIINFHSAYLKINDVSIYNETFGVSQTHPKTIIGFIPVAKNDVIKAYSDYNTTTYGDQEIYFYPMKGAN